MPDRSPRHAARFFAPALLGIVLSLMLLPARAAGANGNHAGEPSWIVCFTPPETCTENIVMALEQAQATVLVQAYSFTSAPIAKALVEAHKRGVAVEVILDKSQRKAQYSSADFLAHAGIPTRIDAAHAIAHNKVMVIDGQTVITGSFNFTKAADKSNAENLLVIQDRMLADKYTENWQTHADHSEPYVGKDGTP